MSAEPNIRICGRRASIRLPELAPDQLVLLVETLHELASEIWAAHEPDIGEHVARSRAELQPVETSDDELPF